MNVALCILTAPDSERELLRFKKSNLLIFCDTNYRKPLIKGSLEHSREITTALQFFFTAVSTDDSKCLSNILLG